MPYDQDKIYAFEQVIARETDEKIHEFKAEIEEFEQEELEKTKNLEYAKMYSYMQDQVQAIKSQYKQILTRARLDSRRELLSYRNELADRVFRNAEEKLLSFSETPAYTDYLERELKKALEELSGDDLQVLVKKEDMQLEAELKSRLGDRFSFCADKKNRLGGFVIKDLRKGLLIDKTFLTALEDQRPSFYQECGLKVNL